MIHTNLKHWIVFAAIFVASCSYTPCAADENSPRGREFFESRIRPVLVEHCYRCHNSTTKAEADLALDWREGIRSDSPRGTVVVPREPKQSILLLAIGHEMAGAEMPKGKPQLSPEVIADFQEWIRMGAPDPRDAPPYNAQQQAQADWKRTLAARKKWWSFQPIQSVTVPKESANWSDHPIDRFTHAQWMRQELKPAPDADRRTLIRRLTFALTGLPPTPAEIDAFLQDQSPDALEQLADRLLQSPRFGERWARHWMDVMRYADSHGSEGDPNIPHAYQYRDYLIRAFNDDVPYNQLILEHLAGDLLENPRINDELGINEAAIGPAHLRLVFHGFAPTDALDEKVRFTDDQINVFSKAFLGLTISCARCHDHKFDAISQADYYALFGIFGSCRPALRDVNTQQRQQIHRNRLQALKGQIKEQIAAAWLESIDTMASKLQQALEVDEKELPNGGISKMWRKISEDANVEGASFEDVFEQQLADWKERQTILHEDADLPNAWQWNLASRGDYESWFAYGNGMAGPAAAGEFAVASDGDTALLGVYPAGAYSHGVSTKHRGFSTSPRFHLDEDYNVWMLLRGDGKSTVRYAVQHYPRSGTVYPVPEIRRNGWYWQHFNLDYWNGDDVHLEIATAKDAPLEIRNSDRSWFGVRKVVVRKKGLPAPPNPSQALLDPVFAIATNRTPQSLADLAECISEAARASVIAWQQGNMSDQQAMLVDAHLQDKLLPNRLDELQSIESLIHEYRQLEAEIALPTRVPGVIEAEARNQPLFARGDHRKPLDAVPRRFLEAINATPYRTSASGRLELARDLVREDNPLVARVMVNRIWHHLFGRGIVATPDNLGRLGEQPSHPQLLDFLARRFMDESWSIKEMIRFVVLSRTWQLDSSASQRTRTVDPQNMWIARASVRRLDAEAIRDALIFVSGELDDAMSGPGFGANGDSTRRSVYVLSRRNSLDRFLQTFDSPVPFATTGRRSRTNVPAQSLTMLNDPLVQRLAEKWAERVMKELPNQSDQRRIAAMFEQALGRPPRALELHAMLQYASSLLPMDIGEAAPDAQRDAYSRIAHAIFNLKEFIYVQ